MVDILDRRPLTIKEVAERWSVSPRTVWSWIHEGRLKTRRLSPRSVRIAWEDVEEFERMAPQDSPGPKSTGGSQTSGTSSGRTGRDVRVASLRG